MRFAELVRASAAVAATPKRTEKRDRLAALLRQLAPGEIAPAVAFLAGEPRQGRVGIGQASLWRVIERGRGAAAAPRDEGEAETVPPLSVADVDRCFDEILATQGPGAAQARDARLTSLLARATPQEADFLARLLVGELRQGALEGVMVEAVAHAAGISAPPVRRAAMLSGDLAATAHLALVEGEAGLRDVSLEVGRPVQSMLASSSPDVDAALAGSGPASVEWKLDGARVQVHRAGGEVRIFTRNRNEVTDRLPEVVAIVADFDAHSLVLDGEVLGLRDDGTPRPFQETMSRFGSETAGPGASLLRPHFFDVLHRDGALLIDRPLAERLDHLEAVAGRYRVPGVVTSAPAEALRVLGDALAAGHEGVVVKGLDTLYEAGRRGSAWRKVKPVRSLDLVVLAAEWGHGRRRGWLSNLHLGARDPERGGFVMVGKTFKGLTDALLRWQTERLQALAVEERGGTLRVRPELVVEILLDGVQRSPRYPGGVALRFARVKGYRPDRDPASADTLETVRALLPQAE